MASKAKREEGDVFLVTNVYVCQKVVVDACENNRKCIIEMMYAPCPLPCLR